MSISTMLEMTRASHEDIERLERLILNDLRDNDPQKLSRVEIYENKGNPRKDDQIEATLDGQTAMFYHLLKEIREHYRCRPTAQAIDNITDEYEQQLQRELPQIKFSGEEGYGRYLDMHELHRDFVNSKFGKQIDYSEFIEVFPQLQHIPSKMKMSRPYMDYLSKMLDYLVSFLIRTEPLQDVDRLFTKVAADFESGWKENVLPVPEQNALIDLDFYGKAEELVEIGPERLKQALGALGLKTGGTVQQRAERLFLTKDTPLEKLDKKHFSIGARKPEQKEDRSKEIALREVKIKTLCDILSETIMRTKENIERKQALTYEEMEVEREESELVPQAESDDEQQIYNPLKIPMGWDGRPIPLWLYKLHGLGQECKCEICGNYSYRGRRAYERHFKESQHQNGMRRLGIPNSKDFSEITSIEEARQLWGIIKEKQAVNKWRPELEKEYEDEEGNIYNQKTYTDLLRQGLIHPTKRRCILQQENCVHAKN
ncbi:splicing factor SF3a60 [Tanacetum coccineum]